MKSLISILFLVSFLNFAQNKSPYQLFDKNEKKVSYKKLLKNIENADVLLFGEYHNNSIVHWLQLELTKDLAQKKQVILGAEMLEADNQKQVNQYLNDEIDSIQIDFECGVNAKESFYLKTVKRLVKARSLYQLSP